MGYAYEVWNVDVQGDIPSATLQGYPVAIWHTSNQDDPLSGAEQSAIEDYLAGGGNLFLTGEDIDEQVSGTTFYSDVLHAATLSTAGFFTLEGVTGDPISDGHNLTLVGAGGAGNSQSPSSIDPVGPDAYEVYTYTTTGLPGCIRWEGTTEKLVYFACNFEAVSGIASTTREEVLENTFTWFDLGSPPPPPPVGIALTPYGTPIQIPSTGGSFDYNIAATNNESTSLLVTVWCDVTLPNGSIYGPTLGPVSVTLAAGVTADRDRTQVIPGGAPAGNYSYNAYAVADGDTATDSFPFSKLADGDGSSGILEWANFGDSFDQWLTEGALDVTPENFSISGAYPNPFNPVTTISFALPEAGKVLLNVYDVNGRLVERLVDGYRNSGVHEVTFDASNLASAIYVYLLEAGQFTASGKMVLMK
jgi:hypothetical protein